jgi:hypothetical protein
LETAAVCALLLGVAWAQQQGQLDHQAHHPAQADAPATTQPAGPMGEMCKMHMQMMTDLKDTLDQAKQAAQAGNTEQAARKIQEAQDLIEKQHANMHEKMQGRMGQMMSRMGEGKMKCPMCGEMMGGSQGVSNARCPMDQMKLKTDQPPEAATREYKGETIGFCCSHCAEAWDKLSAADKQAKVDALAMDKDIREPSEGVGQR